jgi:hypothetical protein
MRRLIFMALAGVLCISFGSAARAATGRNASRYHHRQKPGQYRRCEGNGREPSHRSFSDNNDFEFGDVRLSKFIGREAPN